MLKKSLFTLLFAVACIGYVNADTSHDVKREKERVISLLEHGRYSEARHTLQALREKVSVEDVSMVRYVDFALARCAAELRDDDTEDILLAYLRRYPETVYVNEVYFMLAMYYCENENYDNANKYLDIVSYATLNERDREKYNMRKAYLEFVAGRYERAYELFSRLSPSGIYADHATYYKSYIHYARGEYKKAYDGFDSLKSSDNYAKIIPYYLFQIEFASGNYEYVVSNGDELLKRSVELERADLMRVIAEASYRLESYNKSYVYMSMYQSTGGKMGREEYYLLGFSAYRLTDYKVAIDALSKVVVNDDELSQNASYHLADCYIRIDDKKNAIHAFAAAAAKKHNREIAEDALFNYGKLLFETGGGVFNESINVLTRYVTDYPNSARVDEARELLIAAYYNSRDYKTAYEAIKAFPNPDSEQRAALQKIAYFNGLEAFKANDKERAESAFNEALSIGVAPKYKALSLFWLGELAYSCGDYAKAIGYYDRYLKSAPKSEYEYKMALYNLGYARFVQEEVAQSQKAFEGFLWLYKTLDRYRADALNRLGDTQYLQRNYVDAAKSYESAIALGTSDQDYAKYHRAIALGLAGDVSAKITALQQMQDENCGDYNDDASYELGRTYVSLGKYDEAAKALERFVERYASSEYYFQALLNLGLVHLNLGNSDESLKYYDKIISVDAQSSAARDAIQSVREIYVAKGDIDAYFKYAERTGAVCDTSVMARDSLSFRAAQNFYHAGRIPEAISQLSGYLKHYPKGYYTNEALYSLSDCYLQSDSLNSAISTMERLSKRPKNQYTVSVVEMLADLTLEYKMYDKSAAAFRRLYDVVESSADRTKALNGYAESALLRNDKEVLFAVANALDTLQDVDADMLRRVRFAKAKAHASSGESVEAMQIYKALAANVSNVEGAESAYLIIKMLFDEGKYEESEAKIYELADSKTPHSYWLGKSFILLGDIYMKRDDIFQARATYRSVVDGYTPTNDGIVAEAQSKLDKTN